MLDQIEHHWNGPRWRLVSFVAGVLCVPFAVLLAMVLSLASGERFVPLIMLLLVLLILGASLAGSGFIDSLTSHMNKGGLARDASEHVESTLSPDDRESRELDTKERRDRRTIRSGLVVIAPLVTFVYLMTIV